MNEFIRKHAAAVIGILAGFDRLLFRGTLRNLCFAEGLGLYLNVNRVLLKDAGAHFDAVSERVKGASASRAERAKRPVLYLRSSEVSKEAEALKIAARDGIREGLVCVLTCVEPCWSFQIERNREAKRLILKRALRKCLHHYHYWLHPQWGLMHARLQTWFPFGMQVCLNGREGLAKSLDRAGVRYEKRDNCFTWLEDAVRAQALADEHLKTDWSGLLDGLALEVNPDLKGQLGRFSSGYYWSTHQSEWATDVMFRSAADLGRLYPALVRHGMLGFKSPDVLRFLGQAVKIDGGIPAREKREIGSSFLERREGVRIKHRAGMNSVKMYDKQGSVLRTETTINDAGDFKAFRPKEGGAADDLKWRTLRQGVADLHRRAEISDACNTRYLDALAVVEDERKLEDCLSALSRPAMEANGRRARALNVFGEDGRVLSELGRGEFTLNGFRNGDLQRGLYGTAAETPEARRKRSGKITRLLRLLKAHKLIRKVPKTHRYQLTEKGRLAVTALSVAKQSSIKKLNELAA
ncbi:MAG: hypothetical protein JOY77_08585 [Alphaproteobacteria bacterium]|nr:hypothetical protein [Alphaproteobacteria bacterium]